MHTRWVLVRFFALCICVFCVSMLCGCREQILHNLTEGDANRIMNELSQSSLNAEKVKQTDGKWSIAVASSQVPNALSLLQKARLMKDEPKVTEANSFIGSREDQRFKFERNLSREIERSIAAIDGVLEVRVHLNLPPIDPLFGQKVSGIKGSASLLIVAKNELQITKDEIAALVGGAAGIDKDAVTVLISHEAPDSEQIQSISLVDSSTSHLFREGIAIAACLLVGLGAFLIIKVTKRGESLERNILREKLRANELRSAEERTV